MVSTVRSHRTIPFILGSPEYQVMAQGIPRGGFSVDRPRLPTEVENEIVDKLGSRLAPEREPQFRAHLRLMFATFVEVHKAHGAYRVKQFDTDSDLNGREKATTRVARRLKTHERRYRRLSGQTHVAERQLSSFFRRLTRDIGVSGALNAVLVKKRGWNLNQYRHPEMRSQVFRELEEALQLVKDDLSAAVKTGREEPVLNQLCQSLLALIENMTGKCPGRSNIAIRSKAETAKLAPEEDDDKQREGGYFLEICRLMTAAVYDALPVAERPSRNRDMVKLVRNATKKHRRAA